MSSIRNLLVLLLLILSVQLAFSQDNQPPARRKSVSFQATALSTTLLDHFQKLLGKDQYISDYKISQNGLVVVLLIFESPPGRGGSDYTTLIIAHINKEQDKVLSEETYLPETALKTEAGEPWISELGQISNRGDKILVRVGTQSAPVAPYTCSYNWQMREVPSGKIMDLDIFGEGP